MNVDKFTKNLLNVYRIKITDNLYILKIIKKKDIITLTLLFNIYNTWFIIYINFNIDDQDYYDYFTRPNEDLCNESLIRLVNANFYYSNIIHTYELKFRSMKFSKLNLKFKIKKTITNFKRRRESEAHIFSINENICLDNKKELYEYIFLISKINNGCVFKYNLFLKRKIINYVYEKIKIPLELFSFTTKS